MGKNTIFSKKVLFTDDSITNGALGCSYLELLEKQFSHFEFINPGQDGDTVFGIMNKTLQ